jgi:CBS domain-containing protein
MKISDVMTWGAECTGPDATLQQAAERMKTLDVGVLPVCEDGLLVGMITDRDIAVRSTALGEDPTVDRVGEVMTPSVIYCYDDQDIAEAAELMAEKQIRRLPVLNREKQLIGIVSLGDLAVETGDDQLAGETLEGISEPLAAGR